MTVVYHRSPGENARHFGPYLGGRKVPDAVSGLGRVLPLGYAADRYTGAERELARMRGASPGAREAWSAPWRRCWSGTQPRSRCCAPN